LISNALNETGIVNFRMGDFDIAIDNLSVSLKIREQSSNKATIAETKNELGNVNLFQSNYSKALEYYFEALQIREELKDMEKKAHTLNNIGLVYMYQENLDEALKYLQQSLLLKEKYGDNKTIARSHNNVGLIYELKEEFKKSLNSYFRALEYLDTLTDQSTITTLDNNIGLIYSAIGEYDKALYYLKKCLKAKEQMGEKMDIAQALTSIGKTYRKKYDFNQAILFGEKGLKLAFEINSKKEIQEASLSLFLTYELIEDYKKALKYHKITEDYSDSLLNEQQSKEIGRLEAKYFYDKERAEEEKIRLEQENIEEIQKNRNRIIIISGFALLIALFIIGVTYMKNLGKKNEIITSQNEKLETILKNLKEAQAKLIHSEKMASLGVLVAGVAHEINNPINFVYAGINSLMLDFEDIIPVINEISKIEPEANNLKEQIIKIKKLKEENCFNEAYEAIPQMITQIMLGADRTAEIVKGLRSFSRTNKEELKFLDIHEGINSSLLLLKNKYKNRIEIIKDFDTKISLYECNTGKINQVFLNIFSNAIDAILDEGKIWISTKKKDENIIIISIKDTGCGMNTEVKEKLFDPFYTTKPIGKGTGLGLSITYGIIKEHNGEIKVISELNKGTEFIITLPIK